MNQKDPIIQVKNVTKKFPGNENPVLDHINLDIHEGDFFGLLGPNGAGKTTLISILYGIIENYQGEVYLFGKNFKENKLFIQNQIGVVPQEYALYPTLTAYENLLFFGKLYDIPTKKLKDKIDEGLKEIGLYDFKNKRIETFSGGMKRRINLLSAILHNPKVLFLDEPTVGVDIQSKEALIKILKDLNQQNTTILYTSHHLNEAEILCSRVGVLDKGNIILEGPTQQLLQTFEGKNSLEKVFLHLTGSDLRDHV